MYIICLVTTIYMVGLICFIITMVSVWDNLGCFVDYHGNYHVIYYFRTAIIVEHLASIKPCRIVL